MTTLSFDIFGTVLDLTGSLVPPLTGFLAERGAKIDAEALWAQWRARQRIEQYQDTIIMLDSLVKTRFEEVPAIQHI